MKHYLLYALALLCMVSCEKMPENGDLDGTWRLMQRFSKTSVDDGNYSACENKQDAQIDWAFQLKMLSIRTPLAHNGFTNQTVARFTHQGDQLFINEVYVHFRERDSLITDPNTTLFNEIGIRGNSAKFAVKRLDSSGMTLCSDRDSLIFKKMK